MCDSNDLPKSSSIDVVPSAVATGGAGPYFEQHVGAYWLAQLLVGAIPPVLKDCIVTQVCFQTNIYHFHTDDFLVVGTTSAGTDRKLLGQVKRTLTISKSNEDFAAVIVDCWNDFHNEHYDSGVDRFAIATLQGSTAMLTHLNGLFNLARDGRDFSDFELRLREPHFTHERVRKYFETIKSIVLNKIDAESSDEKIWKLLRVLHLVSLDLNTDSSQAESHMRTLLAFTVKSGDAASVADSTWNALLAEVGQSAPRARCYEHTDLPTTLREQHARLTPGDTDVLDVLHAHSQTVLDGITSTLGGDYHLPRSGLRQQVLEGLEADRAVVVSGVAGVGKSGVAKSIAEALSTDHFVLCFRAEEFARAHLDEVLLHAHVQGGIARLNSVLAGQDKKILLVESVERLVESATKDAFTDLLRLVKNDDSWRVILTCRDYQRELIETAFLDPLELKHSLVNVSALNDDELSEVSARFPQIEQPLACANLLPILRNPFVLNLALRLSWSSTTAFPQNEREFRNRFWAEILRLDQNQERGRASRRQEVFIEIAIRRAKSLTPYVPCNDLDHEIVQSLVFDSLLVFAPDTDSVAAPAHDVLEDWAILRWLTEQYAQTKATVEEFAKRIGGYPALRRTYKKWVGELLIDDADAVGELISAISSSDRVSDTFRDDTFVGMMRERSAQKYILNNKDYLFQDDKRVLKRLIHLLRIACVREPEWLAGIPNLPFALFVPYSSAWATVLSLVSDSLDRFDFDDRNLLLGLVVDWARGVSERNSTPDGSPFVAKVALWLLPDDDYHARDEELTSILSLVSRIPKELPEKVEQLLLATRDDKNFHITREFRKLVLADIDGNFLARDLPDIVIRALYAYLFFDEEEVMKDPYYGGSIDTEIYFGLEDSTHFDFFPPSALRGPFGALLKFHPRAGLDFIVEFTNRCAEIYAKPNFRGEQLETPGSTILTFEDGFQRSQICSWRLWGMHRATVVGPGSLQSVLMALEAWLLEVAKHEEGDVLDSILTRILRESNSVALTSVVASIATAHPHKAGKSLLAILSSRECIQLDTTRKVSESDAPSRVLGSFPRMNAKSMAFEKEREESDALTHRKIDLETAVLLLQTGPMAEQVHKLLDEHRQKLPPEEDQGSEDHIWRLSLHRMDLRLYTVSEADSLPDVDMGDETSHEEQKKHLKLELEHGEADLQEMTEKAEKNREELNDQANLLMWGVKVLRNEEPDQYDPADWQRHISAAMATHDMEMLPDFIAEGPAIVAAVCVHHAWEQMSEDERRWSLESILSSIGKRDGIWTPFDRAQQNSMASDRSCAWVLPSLLQRELTAENRRRVLDGISISITHPVDEVRSHAAAGIGFFVGATDPALAIRFASAMAEESILLEGALTKTKRPPGFGHTSIEKIQSKIAIKIRDRLGKPDGITDDSLDSLDVLSLRGINSFRSILNIFMHMPNEPKAVWAYRKLADTLAYWWKADRDYRSSREIEGNHHVESVLQQMLEYFLFTSPLDQAAEILAPILESIDDNSREVQWLVRGLVNLEYRRPHTDHFWALWSLFASRIKEAKWLPHLRDKYSEGSEVVHAIFLGTGWEENIRHWSSLEGYEDRVHALFEELPYSSCTTDSYVRFLYHIGDHSLPMAFVRVQRKLQECPLQNPTLESNTVFMLESLLQRFVYSRPQEVKRNAELRDAVLNMLDLLVDLGSAAAFRMRDDFVTPWRVPQI